MYTCVWPRGVVGLNADLGAVCIGALRADPVLMACRMVQYHMHTYRSSSITLEQWEHIMVQKTGLTKEMCRATFDAARLVELSNSDDPTPHKLEEPCDDVPVAALALVCSLYRCDAPATTSFTADLARPTSVGSTGQRAHRIASDALFDRIISNLNAICAMLLLCDEEMAERFVLSGRGGSSVPNNTVCPDRVVRSFDMLFEGCLVDATQGNMTSLPVSQIIQQYWSVNGKMRLGRLVDCLRKCLQTDPFTIHDRPIPTATNVHAKGSEEGCREKKKKRLSHPPFPHDSKFSLTQWTHVEVLNQETLNGCHLRIRHGDANSSSLFAPQYAESATVADCHHCGCIVLGPVRNTVFLRELSHCSVSVVCSRLVMDRCHDITVYLCVALSPLLVDCHAVQLAPFNAPSDPLEFALCDARMELYKGHGRWDQPLIVHNSGHSESESTVQMLDPDRFQLLPVPFSTTNDSFNKRFLESLPAAYAESVECHREGMRAQKACGVGHPLTSADWSHLEQRAAMGQEQLYFAGSHRTYGLTIPTP